MLRNTVSVQYTRNGGFFEMSDNSTSNIQEKMHYMLWSVPPKESQQDMTAEQRNILQQHFAYWTDKQNQGIALFWGRVLKPNDPHGMAIIEVENADEVTQLISEDPAVMAEMITVDFFPMMVPPRKTSTNLT